VSNCTINSQFTACPILIEGEQNGNIHIDGLIISRNAFGNALQTAIIELAPCNVSATPADQIQRLFLSRITVDDTLGSSYSPIATLIQFDSPNGNIFYREPSIAKVVLGEVAPEHLTALCNTYSQITTIAGTGLLGTGWQLPDAQVANNTLYVSATSGVPSIKVAGVPHAL
jgi:hypothetical protein